MLNKCSCGGCREKCSPDHSPPDGPPSRKWDKICKLLESNSQEQLCSKFRGPAAKVRPNLASTRSLCAQICEIWPNRAAGAGNDSEHAPRSDFRAFWGVLSQVLPVSLRASFEHLLVRPVGRCESILFITCLSVRDRASWCPSRRQEKRGIASTKHRGDFDSLWDGFDKYEGGFDTNWAEWTNFGLTFTGFERSRAGLGQIGSGFDGTAHVFDV